MIGRALEEQIRQGNRYVVIDLQRVDYMSGAGLLALDSISRELDIVGGKLLICAPGEPVTLVLELAGWDDRFGTAISRSDAVRRLTR